MEKAPYTPDERRLELARRIVQNSLAELCMDMPFLDTALFRLRFRAGGKDEVRTWITDGIDATYNVRNVLERYRVAQGAVAHDILHVVMHCVFSHMFVEAGIEQRLWNLACDIAVESLIDSLGIDRLADGGSSKRGAYLAALIDMPDTITAEKVFRLLSQADLSEEDLLVLEDAFFVDDHPWYWAHAMQSDEGGRDSADAQTDAQTDADPTASHEVDTGMARKFEQAKKEWKEAAESVQTGLETVFARAKGHARDTALLQALRSVNRKRYDYKRFLSSFCTWGEQVKIDMDGFDYIYYTYGMDAYGDMPLVEPLEYKDVKKLKDVVIALDTSGSVSGDLMQLLFERTYDLIENEENAHRAFRIHLVQCDTQVQDDVRICNRDDLERALEGWTFKGLGGTDYNPVFSYVDELIAQGEFVDFKGVIYFTDGRGEYPARPAAYKAAFVILGEENADVQVPPWAIKLVLGEDEVRKL